MPDRITPHRVIKIKGGGGNTSHECEFCGKEFAGYNSSLIELDNGEDRIVCENCRYRLFHNNGNPRYAILENTRDF